MFGMLDLEKKMQQERERAMRHYNISPDATEEEIRMQVYEHLTLPTYDEFKRALYEHIKEVGIKETKEDVIDIFNPDSDVWVDTCHFYDIEGIFWNLNDSGNWNGVENLYTDVEDWFFSVVFDINMIYAFDDDEMNDIHTFSDFMPIEYEDRNPLVLLNKYLTKMEKEDFDELKNLIMSLAQDAE